MRKLILVKHSLPEIIPSVPSQQWPLSDEGRRRCHALAERLAQYQPAAVVTSSEPKAMETAEIVARLLGVPMETAEGLHENDRTGFPYLPTGQWEAAFVEFFAHPDRVVMGKDTADEAHRRFAAAIAAVGARHPSGNLVVVAHGTVITLFVARAVGLEPFPFWKRLGLPSLVVLSLPELDLLTVVESVV